MCMISFARHVQAVVVLVIVCLPMAVTAPVRAGDEPPRAGQVFQATDTLAPMPPGDGPARLMLERLFWTPADFQLHVERTPEAGYHAIITFPAPPVTETAVGALARMRWYAATNEAGEVVEAPAVLIVHSLHPRMIIANTIAAGFASQGLHAFVLEMPGYGTRRKPPQVSVLVTLERATQAVAEVRRARDAIAALTMVADGPIALQGTSLGGFVAAVAGAIDGAFDPVLLLLAGADGYTVLRDGKADAARLRELTHRFGYSDDDLRRILGELDPQHVAHRLDPRRTWLFSAAGDQVVPRRNSDLLADIIGLNDDHHLHIGGDHYTVMFALPTLVRRMSDTIKGETTVAAGLATPTGAEINADAPTSSP